MLLGARYAVAAIADPRTCYGVCMDPVVAYPLYQYMALDGEVPWVRDPMEPGIQLGASEDHAWYPVCA